LSSGITRRRTPGSAASRAPALAAALLPLAAGALGLLVDVARLSAQGAATPAPRIEALGHADYDWHLETLAGGELSFRDFEGDVVVVNAWATWCPPCVAEMASFAELREALADTEVRFVFITAEDADHVRDWLRPRPWKLPVYIETQRMPKAFGSFGLPTTWIVDREGRIVLRRDGAAHWATPEVESFLRVLAGGRARR
jgi:thiol-disulfide isomerase/thioredoxin